MKLKYGQIFEVDKVEDLPQIENKNDKFFTCIGGDKSFQCFYESKKLSRADFLEKYNDKLDSCLEPIFEDKDILIRQDVQFAIPGFYVIATKQRARRILELDKELYAKCLYMASIIKKIFIKESIAQNIFIGHEEHFKKPASAHIWVLPIYGKEDINAFDGSLWNYMDKKNNFSINKPQILAVNQKMKDLISNEIKSNINI